MKTIEQALLEKILRLEEMGWLKIGDLVVKEAFVQSILDTFEEAPYGAVQQFLRKLIP